MASKIERGAKVDLDEADCPDWALARLKSLRRSVLPAPLLLAPSNQVMDGGTGVWMAGHPWCTALKLTSPPSDAGLLRTILFLRGKRVWTARLDNSCVQLEAKATGSKMSFGITYEQRVAIPAAHCS